jgi:DNA repair exonuclease SbcCD nuclease subunit
MKLKKADLILTADWHIREKNPECRTDDYVGETQWEKIDFISNLQKEHNCPVICAGDLFDHWKPSHELVAKTMQHLPKQFFSLYGNHELPQHNLQLRYKSGTYVLEQANFINYDAYLIKGISIHFYHYGEKPTNKIDNGKINILVWHTMVYKGKQLPYPGCIALSAKRFLKKYNSYDLIVTGDNHTPFIEEYEGNVLVNSGSISRQEAGQIKHKPRVYLWYAKTNKVEPVYIPIKKNVITRQHLEIAEKREERITAFVERLNTDWEGKISFESNLKIFNDTNKIKKPVYGIILKSLENE